MEQNRKHFYELSLEYVCKLQEIQERKKFECVEPVSTSELIHSTPSLIKDWERIQLEKSPGALFFEKMHVIVWLNRM